MLFLRLVFYNTCGSTLSYRTELLMCATSTL
jgi:hypothetical protein